MEVDEVIKTHDNNSTFVFNENAGSLTQSVLENPSVSNNDTINSNAVPAAKMLDTADTFSSGESSRMHSVPSYERFNCVDPEAFKKGDVKIYAEDTGPKFYPVKGNVVTPPIISKNLPEAFSYLPIYGRPKCKADLEEFQNNKIREYVGYNFSEKDFATLARYCSPTHLITGKELRMPTNAPTYGILSPNMQIDGSSDGDHLNIVKKFKLRVERDKANLYVKKLKYRGMRMLPLSLEDSDEQKVTIGTPLEPGKDLLFRVRFYRPFCHGKDRVNSRHSVFSCDLLIPGRCRLGALRERVVCPNDADLRLDVSDAPYDAPSTTAKELFPSGFMFINNVFYVDERDGRKDYSAPIREWAKRRGIGDFPKRDMNAVRVDELIIKLGHPDVYVHQGNCEHLFTFSEIRLLGAGDPLLASHFPRHTCALQHQTVYCTTCAEFGAKWLATGCSRVPFDPAFFCDTCFKLYLYNDGRKIGNFKAYSFRGNELNLLKPLG